MKTVMDKLWMKTVMDGRHIDRPLQEPFDDNDRRKKSHIFIYVHIRIYTQAQLLVE